MILRKKLIEQARVYREGAPITYKDLSDFCGLNYDLNRDDERNALRDQLTHIDRQEREKGRPLLGALVIRKDLGRPGDGFYVLCEEFFKEDKGTLKKNKEFLKRLQKECSEFWKNEDNYRRYG